MAEHRDRSPDRAIHVTVYRNGDNYFKGQTVTLNKKKIRNFDAWLDELTRCVSMKTGGPVRTLFTPIGGTKIQDYDTLEEGCMLVAAAGGWDRFKRLNYSDIRDKPRTLPPINRPPPEPGQSKRFAQISGRSRKVDTHSKLIKCWANGDDTKAPKPIVLSPLSFRSLDRIMSEVSTKLSQDVHGPVEKLCLPNGSVVRSVDQILPHAYYVALRRQDRFKGANYQESSLPNISTSPRVHTNPPPFITKSTKSSSQSSPEHSISSNNGYRRERAKREQDQAGFHSRPIKHKRSSEKPRQVDYDEDAGGVYKAKKPNQATRGARQVEDSHQTRTDLPVDQRRAEEVKEDIRGKDKKDKKGKKQDNGPTKEYQEQQRTYRTNARRPDSPSNEQARKQAEKKARERREEEDRQRAEKNRQQQEALRRKKEEKDQKEKDKDREEEERRKREEEEAERRRYEVEEERRRLEEEDREMRRMEYESDEEQKRLRREQDRDRTSTPNRNQDSNRRDAESPYRTGTEMLHDDQHAGNSPTRDGRDRTPDQHRGNNPRQDEEDDWGPGPDEEDPWLKEEQDKAATKIQAGFRGMKARREYKAMRTYQEG